MNFNSSTALCSINKHSNELPACRLFAQNVVNSRGCHEYRLTDPDQRRSAHNGGTIGGSSHSTQEMNWLPPFNCTGRPRQWLNVGERLTSDYSKLIRLSGGCQNTQQQTMHYYRSAQKSKKYLLRLRSPFLSELQATRFLHLWWLILLLSMILPCLLDLLTISS